MTGRTPRWSTPRWSTPRPLNLPTLTLLGRCCLILGLSVGVNVLLWILAVCLLQRKVLSLALVAWTTGLRHALDADHIAAIDNGTRRIVAAPPGTRRPVTVGLFFSLGHSTVVVVTTVAVAASLQVASRLDGFEGPAGIIGASVSSSFLLLVGAINSVILWRTCKAARRAKANGAQPESHPPPGFLTRLAMPLLRLVDRPWKLYPIGLLFGLGFDTASSIALLSVAAAAMSAGAVQAGASPATSDAKVVLLALLFTAGMTLVDSADSCLMIWAYAPEDNGPGRQRFALVRKAPPSATDKAVVGMKTPLPDTPDEKVGEAKDLEQAKDLPILSENDILTSELPKPQEGDAEAPAPGTVAQKLSAPASRASLLLTLLSILIAFAIGLIVLMGLIGSQCARCERAADKEEESGDGGLEGRWWLAWRKANDQSGYVGAGIVGAFALCVAVWAGASWWRRRKERREQGEGVEGEFATAPSSNALTVPEAVHCA